MSIVLICALCLIAAGASVAILNQRSVEATAHENERVQAAVLAHTVTAALAFGDAKALSQYVDALGANTSIEAAGVYDERGRLTAAFHGDLLPDTLSNATATKPGTTIAIAPVIQDGSPLGTVLLRQRTEGLPARAMRFVAPVSLVILSMVMLSIMGADSRALARANEALRREIEERERAEAALRQSQKMEAIGRLTGGIAHDFNNMLAIVIGSLDLLLRRVSGGDPRVRSLAEGALDGAQKAASLTHRLLAFSRLQPLKPEPVDVERAVRGLTELLRRTLGETILVETVISGGLWRAQIDRPQLEAAILNLAINARDAMNGGGKLTIEAGNAYLDRAYTEKEQDVSPGQYVLLSITDTGVGIPPENREKVFEPFFTTKPTGAGTGLGLSQVLGFIKQSGGHVSLYSEVGLGTTVKLYLPRSLAEEHAAIGEAQRWGASPWRGVNVLVVEDEPGVRDFVTQALADLGFDAVSAAGPSQALQILEGRDDFGILLTDVVMPEMTGRVLAEKALQLRPSLRVIFMTGYTQNAIVHNGVLDANITLLSKPFTVSQLERELDAVLRRREEPGVS